MNFIGLVMIAIWIIIIFAIARVALYVVILGLGLIVAGIGTIIEKVKK